MLLCNASVSVLLVGLFFLITTTWRVGFVFFFHESLEICKSFSHIGSFGAYYDTAFALVIHIKVVVIGIARFSLQSMPVCVCVTTARMNDNTRELRAFSS
jgi:hypothetical protein